MSSFNTWHNEMNYDLMGSGNYNFKIHGSRYLIQDVLKDRMGFDGVVVTDQDLREELIPTARAYPYEQLLEDCRHYLELSGRRVSFEYILLGGLNDSPRQAEALAEKVRGFQSHVNLIPYNPIEEEAFQRPAPGQVEAFAATLKRRGVAVSVRASRGLDQDAACGQLRRQRQGRVQG